MRRRTLLKGIAATVSQLYVRRILGREVPASAPARQRVRPGDPKWPGLAEWEKLKAKVEGNLLQPRPLFADCSSDANGAACTDFVKNIRNPIFIGDQVAGTEVSGWLDAWTPAPSAYAVRARNANDVAAAVNFARTHNLRLVVKGTGHSYLGTSNAPDSLLVWTRAMKKVTLHDAFVGQNCAGRVKAVPAVTAESGAMWIDLYHAVTTQAGRYVQGGGCTTVGVAGLVQSGGFGSFSKGFGTAASNLLEVEVVTVDGKVRIANECTNSDLYWAIKGGGGGSFGVVTKLTLRTHDLPEFFGFVGGTVTAKSDDAFKRLIDRAIEFYRNKLFNPHWGEQIRFGSGNKMELSMVCQGLTDQQVKDLWQPFFEWIKGSSDFTVSNLQAVAVTSRLWWDVVGQKKLGRTSMINDPRPGAPEFYAWWSGDQGQVGAYLHGYDSLWLSQKFIQPEHRSQFVEALFGASRRQKVELHCNKGIAGAPPDRVAATLNTATNPTVTDAFALAIIANGERPSYPGLPRPEMNMSAARKNAREIELAASELRKLDPSAGSYVSESDYFNKSWQSAYWGSNYARLRSIKRKYDPDGLFFVHHGVGSEDWSPDGFTRV